VDSPAGGEEVSCRVCESFVCMDLYISLSIDLPTYLPVLVVALVERWTPDRKVTGSTPGRGAIKSTRSTQPSIPPG